MTQTPGDEAVAIDTRSLYLRDDLPALYVAPPADTEPIMQRLLVTLCTAHGLPRFDAGPVIERGLASLTAPMLDGWQVTFEYDLGPHDAPTMTVDWPLMCGPLVYDVRKDSPPAWASDAILAGRLALIIGPPLDWPALMATFADGDSVMGLKNLLHALAGRQAAAGVVPVERRR